MMILTDYETGTKIFILPEFVTSVLQLSVSVTDETETPVEHGSRTRITTKDDYTFLVTETSDEVIGLMETRPCQ